MFEKIMAPLDGSESAEVVLPHVEYLAELFGSEIDLVGVCEERGGMDRLLSVYLDKLASQIAVRGNVVHPIILYGQPAPEIVDYGEKNNISLIVMASHGRSGDTRWNMGSVVDKTSKASTAPLLLIKSKVPDERIKNNTVVSKILVPLDGSTLGEAALPYVTALALQAKAEVVLLNVISPTLPLTATESFYSDYSTEIINAQQKEVQGYLQNIVNKLNSEGIQASFKVEVGSTSEKILETADRERIDLIGMSTHGRTGISRWFYGSVAGRILNNAAAPVLLVRAPEMKVSS
ncbi:MAG: universal stress protein [Dehalococcoidia bacterium]|nr:universal stress protein [Dehalococcoidia bacterium]